MSDNDHSLSRVPDEAKQAFWKILFVRIGNLCCVSQLMLGAALGYGLSFWDAFVATMLGSVILQVISWALGTAAAREGLSISLLSRWSGFGKNGSALFGGIVAISMIGWFGVQNAVFGQGLTAIIPFTDALGGLEYPIWTIITGIGITLLVVFGIKAIVHLATIFVPLFVLVVLFAAWTMLQQGGHNVMDLVLMAPPAPAEKLLTLGAATTMVAGGFIAGSICTPDYARYLKNGKQVFWMTLIGTFVGELGMNLLAVLLAHATGTDNIVDIMMATSGVLGVVIVVASTVKLNDVNLYSSGLGLMTLINAVFHKTLKRNTIIWILGIVGTFLSVVGIINYFVDFLTLLGVAVPPVAGIIAIDYYILRRKRKQLDESRAEGKLPSKVEIWNPITIVAWIAGFVVGEISNLIGLGIPGLNSLLFAGILYWAAMKIYAKIKQVDVVEFAETDHIL